MEDLLARYLDGELSEDEARALIRAAERDRAVASALREYEAILGASDALRGVEAPSGFADRVMERIDRRRTTTRFRAARLLPAAATLLLGLLLGYLATPERTIPVERAPTRTPPAVAFTAVAPAPARPGVQTLEAVRLIYRPGRDDIGQVSVAGSFNGWDPGATPMSKTDGAWTILLVLPPGSHEYMLIEDGDRWVTDPSAPRTRDDGFGGVNGVLDVRS
jgi:hypothetical protein